MWKETLAKIDVGWLELSSVVALNRGCRRLAHEEELGVSEHLSEFAMVVLPPSRSACEDSSAFDVESEDKVVIAGGLAFLSLHKFVWTSQRSPFAGPMVEAWDTAQPVARTKNLN